ncbi:hypothetical protein ACFLUJ_06815 [Chloroflexota bacterium]
MIIECPECGVKNTTDKPVESGQRYRCGKCGTLLVYTQTGVFVKVPLNKARLKVSTGTNRNRGWLGCLGLIVVVIVIAIVINLPSSDDSTQETSSTPESTETQTVTENTRHIYEDGAIHVGGDGKPIELLNNPNSTNPTYAELVTFLRSDDTDTKLYLEKQVGGLQPFVCTDFSEAIHNNAEAKGLRAAWVSINFYGEEIGHACNAFETTDRGLVYVDCTGSSSLIRPGSPMESYLVSRNLSEPMPVSEDKIAYLEIDKEYGTLYLDEAISPLYSFYEQYLVKWQEREKLVDEINKETIRYEKELTAAEAQLDQKKRTIETMDVQGNYQEYLRLVDEYNNDVNAYNRQIKNAKALLQEMERVILELHDELGDYLTETMGIVEDIHVQW